MFSNNILGFHPKYDFLWEGFLEKKTFSLGKIYNRGYMKDVVWAIRLFHVQTYCYEQTYRKDPYRRNLSFERTVPLNRIVLLIKTVSFNKTVAFDTRIQMNFEVEWIWGHVNISIEYTIYPWYHLSGFIDSTFKRWMALTAIILHLVSCNREFDYWIW